MEDENKVAIIPVHEAVSLLIRAVFADNNKAYIVNYEEDGKRIDYYGGWKSYFTINHFARQKYSDGKCEGWIIPEHGEVKFVETYEFGGTFGDGDILVGLFIMPNLSCKCGKFKNVDVGVEANLQELIQDIVVKF